MPKPIKFACVGPGGIGCPCCFPAPGSKARKVLIRSAKRQERREAFQVEYDQNSKDAEDRQVQALKEI